MNNKGTHYNTDFKLEVVELNKSRNNLSTVASELNISYETLQRWHKAYDEGKFEEGLPKHLPEQKEIICLKRLLLFRYKRT